MRDPTVLTIILNYRTPEMTLKAAAAAHREMAGIRGEIVIVDNGSGDDSMEVLRQGIRAAGWYLDGRVRLVETGHNGGFGAGNNFSMRAGLAEEGEPDFVYLLNSDAFPEPGAIRRLLRFLQETPGAGIAGSYIRGPAGDPHHTAFRFPTIAGEFEGAARLGVISRLLSHAIVPLEIPQTETQVDWCAGASMLLRRKMLDQIGGFDEAFFLYFEETDLCLRAKRAGWRTHYLPQSEVVHIGSASTGAKKWRRAPGYWFDSRLHYFVKNHGWGYWALATLARLGGGLIWQVRRLLTGKAKADPDFFLWDLTRHSLRALFGRKTKRAPLATSAATIAEDCK